MNGKLLLAFSQLKARYRKLNEKYLQTFLLIMLQHWCYYLRQGKEGVFTRPLSVCVCVLSVY